MINSSKSSQPHSSSSSSLFAKSNVLSSQDSKRDPLSTTSFGTRSRLEIGRFDRVFTTSGSVRRNFADVFRFDLSNRRRVRIYLGNEFSNPRSSNRRMVVDLLDDRTLRRISSTTVTPTGIDALTNTLNPGTYRIRISTQSNDRGRYFMDMVRV